mmetsp:Transcript_47712/g.76915  ORF Transcript_47712/g.76915 Transcript_47712/m.76915 type:complete len:266 (-) Transcript_47712:2182-2979(-)
MSGGLSVGGLRGLVYTCGCCTSASASQEPWDTCDVALGGREPIWNENPLLHFADPKCEPEVRIVWPPRLPVERPSFCGVPCRLAGFSASSCSCIVSRCKAPVMSGSSNCNVESDVDGRDGCPNGTEVPGREFSGLEDRESPSVVGIGCATDSVCETNCKSNASAFSLLAGSMLPSEKTTKKSNAPGTPGNPWRCSMELALVKSPFSDGFANRSVPALACASSTAILNCGCQHTVYSMPGEVVWSITGVRPKRRNSLISCVESNVR